MWFGRNWFLLLRLHQLEIHNIYSKTFMKLYNYRLKYRKSWLYNSVSASLGRAQACLQQHYPLISILWQLEMKDRNLWMFRTYLRWKRGMIFFGRRAPRARCVASRPCRARWRRDRGRWGRLSVGLEGTRGRSWSSRSRIPSSRRIWRVVFWTRSETPIVWCGRGRVGRGTL